MGNVSSAICVAYEYIFLQLHRPQYLLQPGERRLVPTGWSLGLPEGYVSLIWDRSGIAAKNGITNMGGVIEWSYRGEYGVILLNTSPEPYEVKQGDRIAQLLVQPVATAELEEVDELPESARGQGGFGSSGR
jgi:dUTP pyrophosphatase